VRSTPRLIAQRYIAADPKVRMTHCGAARLVADETCVVGRRYNKSLNRSGISGPGIRKTRMLP